MEDSLNYVFQAPILCVLRDFQKNQVQFSLPQVSWNLSKYYPKEQKSWEKQEQEDEGK